MFIQDREILSTLASANKTLVAWSKEVRTHEESDFAHRYMMAHYMLFVQLREALVARGTVSRSDADVATKVAGGPFMYKRE